eukprot:6213758-Pleurochrysis_carterae.AAC.3
MQKCVDVGADRSGERATQKQVLCEAGDPARVRTCARGHASERECAFERGRAHEHASTIAAEWKLWCACAGERARGREVGVNV